MSLLRADLYALTVWRGCLREATAAQLFLVTTSQQFCHTSVSSYAQTNFLSPWGGACAWYSSADTTKQGCADGDREDT
jgi:hypothetical protein